MQCERYEVVCVVMCTGDVQQLERPGAVPGCTHQDLEVLIGEYERATHGVPDSPGMSFCATRVYVCYCAGTLKNVELYAIVVPVDTPSSQCDSNALSVCVYL
jgi:hypothetical protein